MTDLSYASGTCSATTIPSLTAELTKSLRRPSRKTLSLIEKALSYLTPFENMEPRASQPAHKVHTADTPSREADTLKRDLLTLLTTHRMVLTPYIDTHRIETILLR